MNRIRHAGQVQRVAIVGPGGGGKSTFARALGARTNLPVIHLDRHFWKPGWVETERNQWRQIQTELLAGERWIVDGNYGGTFDERFGRADTVIVIKRHRIACVASAVWRTTRYRGAAVQADGCQERFSISFYRWIWNHQRDSRPRLDDAIARNRHLTVVELSSRAKMREFLQDPAVAPSSPD